MRKLLWMSLMLVLAACDDPAPTPPAPPQATVLDGQLKALEKAKAVEAQAAEHKRAMDEKIDGS